MTLGVHFIRKIPIDTILNIFYRNKIFGEIENRKNYETFQSAIEFFVSTLSNPKINQFVIPKKKKKKINRSQQ